MTKKMIVDINDISISDLEKADISHISRERMDKLVLFTAKIMGQIVEGTEGPAEAFLILKMMLHAIQHTCGIEDTAIIGIPKTNTNKAEN